MLLSLSCFREKMPGGVVPIRRKLFSRARSPRDNKKADSAGGGGGETWALSCQGNNRNFLFPPPENRSAQQRRRERREAQKTQAKLVVAANVGLGLSLSSLLARYSYPDGQFPFEV